jgi:hypothetical protein
LIFDDFWRDVRFVRREGGMQTPQTNTNSSQEGKTGCANKE